MRCAPGLPTSSSARSPRSGCRRACFQCRPPQGRRRGLARCRKARADARRRADDRRRPEFRAALAVAAKAARNRLPILIVGEPGHRQGDPVARAIHAASLRAGRWCRRLQVGPANTSTASCSAMTRAPSPAHSRQDRRCVQADGGTLMLDEIGALPPNGGGCSIECSPPARCARRAQRQLFGRRPRDRYLQPPSPRSSDRVSPSGSGGNHRVLLPLRERSGDIPALSRHLLNRFATRPGCARCRSRYDALAVLMRYGWPGNVRQLASGVVPRRGCIATATRSPPSTSTSRSSRAYDRRRHRLSHRPSASRGATRRSVGASPGTLAHQRGHSRARSRISRPTSSACHRPLSRPHDRSRPAPWDWPLRRLLPQARGRPDSA